MWAAGQVTVPAARSTAKWSLVNNPVELRTGEHSGQDLEPFGVEMLAGRAVGVGGVAHDGGLVVGAEVVGHQPLEASRSGVLAGVATTSSMSSESGSTDR